MNKKQNRKIKEMQLRFKRNNTDLIQAVRITYALRLGATIFWYIFIYFIFIYFFDSNELISHIITYTVILFITIFALGLPFFAFNIHGILWHSLWKGTTFLSYYVIRISITILWYALLFFIFTRYFSNTINIAYISLYFVLLVILAGFPFAVFRVHTVFFDSTWKGTVSKIILTKSTVAHQIIIYYETIYIDHEYNETKKWKMKLSKYDDDFNPIGYYKQGDEVVHYRGLKFCEKLDKRNDRHVICLYCGQLNLPENNTCRKCRHTVVK